MTHKCDTCHNFVFKRKGKIMKKVQTSPQARLHVVFCIPSMIIGGTETVFIQTLENLLQNSNLKICIFMHERLREPYFIDWFKKHPQVKLYTVLPFTNINRFFEKITPCFPLKNIRKCVFGLYKRYKRLMLRINNDWKNADIYIDYKNASFFKELSNVSKPKITWFHSSIGYFNEIKAINNINQYDCLVCLTDDFKQDFQSMYPEYSDKIRRIYNPIDIERIKYLAKDAKSYKGKYFCSVARLSYDKDIETILYAFNQFYSNENHPDVDLVLIGDGVLRNKLERIAHSLDCANHIIFVGSNPIPFGYMRDSMAHILSSPGEGFGMVIVEAAAVGALNISSDCKSGPREILMNGDGGILFPVGDVNALSNAMSDVYHNRVKSNEMIECAQRGLKRFYGTVVASDIVKLIKEFVDKK